MTNKQTRGMAVRQDIATWYTPEEKRPPENETVVITFNGPRHIHALGCGAYCEDEGWLIYGMKTSSKECRRTCAATAANTTHHTRLCRMGIRTRSASMSW